MYMEQKTVHYLCPWNNRLYRRSEIIPGNSCSVIEYLIVPDTLFVLATVSRKISPYMILNTRIKKNNNKINIHVGIALVYLFLSPDVL